MIVEDDVSSEEAHLGLIKRTVEIFRHVLPRPREGTKEKERRQDDCTLAKLLSLHRRKENILHQSCLGTHDLDCILLTQTTAETEEF